MSGEDELPLLSLQNNTQISQHRIYEQKGNNLNHLIFNSGKTQGSLYLKRFTKTRKENKNDEGFIEKTQVVELNNRNANMPRSNWLGVYVNVGMGRVSTEEMKEGKLP